MNEREFYDFGPACGWRSPASVPKDGTEVELLLRHQNFRVCRIEERGRWQQITVGHWINFNGGGLCWYGLCGGVIAWRALENRPALNAALDNRTRFQAVTS